MTQQPDFAKHVQVKSQTQDQIDKLKMASKHRSHQSHNQSPDPLAFLNAKTGGLALDQVKVIVAEDGTTTVGNYKLGKRYCNNLGRDLGKGTFGKVRVGTHLLTEEKVAVKILEKDRIADAADAERVQREIKILKLLRHPVVVQLYEIIESEKELFLIMEYARGGELFEHIVSHKRVREKDAARFMLQILSGVEYLHRLGICHRDLKPENLLMDDYNNIKMVDFGLSNTYQPGGTLKTACGSPCYASPEMVAGKRYDGLPADIWSCGVILFAMVCGYLPFEDPKTNLLYKKILAAEYSIPEFVSPDCADLIKSILNTDPTKRFTTEQIRSHAWFKQIKPQKDICGIQVTRDPIPCDMSIVEQSLLKYKKPLRLAKDLKNDIQNNRHNSYTTTYYLILKRFIRQGGKTIADITKYDADIVASLLREEQMKDTLFQRPFAIIQNDYQSQSSPHVVFLDQFEPAPTHDQSLQDIRIVKSSAGPMDANVLKKQPNDYQFKNSKYVYKQLFESSVLSQQSDYRTKTQSNISRPKVDEIISKARESDTQPSVFEQPQQFVNQRAIQNQQQNLIMKQQQGMLPTQLTRQFISTKQQPNKVNKVLPNNFIASQPAQQFTSTAGDFSYLQFSPREFRNQKTRFNKSPVLTDVRPQATSNYDQNLRQKFTARPPQIANSVNFTKTNLGSITQPIHQNIIIQDFVKRRMSPKDFSPALSTDPKRTTANSRYRQTSYNLQPQNVISPINVITNSLNITIYKGSNEQPQQRTSTKSKARQYFSEQLANFVKQ